MREFYNGAEQIWEEQGLYHYTNRLTLKVKVTPLHEKCTSVHCPSFFSRMPFVPQQIATSFASTHPPFVLYPAQDFIQELRARLPHAWFEGLQEKAKHLYFAAKEAGNFPRWYSVDDEV